MRKDNSKKHTIYTGAQLKAKRLERGLTLYEMARECHVSVPSLSRCENGLKVGAATAIRLSQYYGEPLQRFWDIE